MKTTRILSITAMISIATSCATAAIDIDPKQYHAQRIAQEESQKEAAKKTPDIKPVQNKPAIPRIQPKPTAQLETRAQTTVKTEPKVQAKVESVVQITNEATIEAKPMTSEPVVNTMATDSSATVDE